LNSGLDYKFSEQNKVNRLVVNALAVKELVFFEIYDLAFLQQKFQIFHV